jgi:hypothetical protein
MPCVFFPVPRGGQTDAGCFQQDSSHWPSGVALSSALCHWTRAAALSSIGRLKLGRSLAIWVHRRRATWFRRQQLILLGSAPELCGDRQRANVLCPPPFQFATGPMKLVVVQEAEGHNELVAHLLAHAVRLGVPNMVCMRRSSTTDKARKICNMAQMGFVAAPPLYSNSQARFVDAWS